ncbi:MAG: glycosyltransferase family 4 protein [Myxococcales bacterium]|nr:glycosyltransferase family 4 protein [Myxococcales bacterium]
MALFFPLHGFEKSGGQPVVGAGVAAADFALALVRHGRASEYQLFAPPYAAGTLRRLLASEPASPRVEVRAYGATLAAFRERRWRVWHDVAGDASRPFLLRAALGADYPVTVTHHTISYQPQLHSLFLGLLAGDVRRQDSIVCTSSAARSAIEKLLGQVAERFNRAHRTRLAFRGRLDLIPLGVDAELFRPREKRALRARLGLPPRAFIFLWVGRLSAVDKADLLPLLRVFRELLRDNRGKELLLVLAGTDRFHDSANLRHYAKLLGVSSRVRIIPDLDPARRHFVHGAADVFVSPADNVQETFGLTPIEAMASGVPQVVSDWDGYRDTVLHGETGFLVPTRWMRCDREISSASVASGVEGLLDQFAAAQSVAVDLAQLKRSLQALIDSPSLGARMAASSRRRAVAEYSWPVVVRRYEELWRELCRIPPSPRPRRPLHSMPDLFGAFAHYASEELSTRAALRLTQAGRDLLEGREALPSYYEGASFEQDHFAELLSSLEQGPARIRELAKGATREPLLRHVMWLLKYGFLEVEER